MSFNGKDFTGAKTDSVVNCGMIKRIASIVSVVVGLYLVANAQLPGETSPLAFYRPEVLNSFDSSILMHQLPMLALLDGHNLPLSTPMSRMGRSPVSLSSDTSFNYAQVRTSNAAGIDPKDSKEVQPLRGDPLYYSGEVGVFYGHQSGKFGGDDYGSYFQGTVGNDKLQISVGGSFDQWNGHSPHWIH